MKKKTTKSEFTSVSYASINSKLLHSAAKLSLIYLKSPCRWAEKLASCCTNKKKPAHKLPHTLYFHEAC